MSLEKQFVFLVIITDECCHSCACQPQLELCVCERRFYKPWAGTVSARRGLPALLFLHISIEKKQMDVHVPVLDPSPAGAQEYKYCTAGARERAPVQPTQPNLHQEQKRGSGSPATRRWLPYNKRPLRRAPQRSCSVRVPRSTRGRRRGATSRTWHVGKTQAPRGSEEGGTRRSPRTPRSWVRRLLKRAQ